MKKGLSFLLLPYMLVGILLTTDAQPQTDKNYLLGEWEFKGGKRLLSLGPYRDTQIETFEENILCFTRSYVEFFPGIFSLREREAIGKYPWKYFGNSTFYKLTSDSLKIFKPGKGDWKKFAIQTVSKDSLLLKSGTDLWYLTRKPAIKSNIIKNNRITAVSVDVFDYPAFSVGYSVRIDEKRVFISDDVNKKGFPAQGYCKYILDKFRRIDVKNLPDKYSSYSGENRILTLCFEFENSEDKKCIKIIGEEYPDELKYALIPLIYAPDFVVDGKEWPRKF